MPSHQVVLTYKEYEVLPADGRRYEIHEGELSVVPAPSPEHQIISGNLFTVLSSHVKANGIGRVLYAPLDVIQSDTSIVQPDIIYRCTVGIPEPSRGGGRANLGGRGPFPCYHPH